MATPVHIVSPLPLQECVGRLRTAINASRYRDLTVEGRITDDTVWLRKVVCRNSFQPFLRGKWHLLPDGTAFRGWVGMHPFVKVFLLVLCGFAGVLGLGLWGSVIQVWVSGVAHPDPHHISNAGAILLIWPLGSGCSPSSSCGSGVGSPAARTHSSSRSSPKRSRANRFKTSNRIARPQH